MKIRQKAVILGSNGRFGKHAAKALSEAGWHCHHFDRAHEDLNAECRDAAIIVNGWNPPYQDWASQVPQLTTGVIKAASQNDARVIIPGNVYVFGMQSGPWDETAEFNPTNKLGEIRAEMEHAYLASKTKTLILRAGDFLDTTASGNWFDLVIAKQLQKGKLISPGDPEVEHAWAYLPDMALAMVEILDRIEERYETVHFPGYSLSLRQISDMLGTKRLQRMNWLPLKMLAPLSPMMRSLISMRYLWDHPHNLTSQKFSNLAKSFQLTPAQDALGASVRGASLSGLPNSLGPLYRKDHSRGDIQR